MSKVQRPVKKQRVPSVFAEASREDDQVEHSVSTVSVKKWHEEERTRAVVEETGVDQAHTKSQKQAAERAYRERAEQFKNSLNVSKSDQDWFVQVTTKGTLRDKLAAYAMAVQDGPFYAVDYIQSMFKVAASENRHEVFQAVEALKDVFCGNELLPADRKLYYFHQRPVNSKSTDDLACWWFEDKLKNLYFAFLRIIEQLMSDTVEYNRERATRFLYDLAACFPMEQQANVLALLCNKLGDPNKKLSSRIIFYMEELLRVHPAQLQAPIIVSVKEVITRAGIPERAVYYGLVFFNQISLSRKHPQVAAELMAIYTVFFRSTVVPALQALHKKSKGATKIEESEPPRVAKVVLTGINRALPYIAADPTTKPMISDLFDPLLKLCRMSNVHIAILSLSLFYQLVQITDNPLQRNLFFNQLTMIVGDWVRLSRFPQTIPNLFKLLDKVVTDEGKMDGRLERLVKRVMNSAVHLGSGFAVAALCWLQKAISVRPALKAMFTLPPENHEDVKDNCLFEIVALSDHFDPVIQSMARAVINGTVVETDGLNVVELVDPRAFIFSLVALAPTKGLSDDYKGLFEAIKRMNGPKEKRSKKRKIVGDDVEVEDHVDADPDLDDCEEISDDDVDLSELDGESELEVEDDVIFESNGESEPEFE